MAKNLTDKLLTTSFDALPEPNEVDNGIWFDKLGLDYGTVIDWARKTHDGVAIPFDPSAWFMLGIMVGLGVGKATCDPTFNLAVELERGQ